MRATIAALRCAFALRGMAAAAPLVVLFGIRGALLAAGVASVLVAVAARALRLHHLRGEPFIDAVPLAIPVIPAIPVSAEVELAPLG